MGNVLNLPSEADTTLVEAKDKEMFELPSASVFSDEYVNSVYDSLPKLDDDIVDSSKKKCAEEVDASLLRLVKILMSSKVKGSSETDSIKV